MKRLLFLAMSLLLLCGCAQNPARQTDGRVVIALIDTGVSTQALYYPAAYDTVLSVGSHDKDKKLSDFTWQNGTVQILAPGEDVILAEQSGQLYHVRGTSYTTGYVSAAAANLLAQEPTLTTEEVRQRLLEAAEAVDDWKICPLP